MKYVCTICGYIYDDEKEKVNFEDLPDTWVCPLCGARKSDFKPLEEKKETSSVKKEKVESKENIVMEEDLEQLSIGQLSMLCSNLARACQKQYKFEEEALFRKLATYFSEITPAVDDDRTEVLSKMILEDVDHEYPKVTQVLKEAEDRGALRACVWGEKVSRMLNSLMKKYEQDGEKMFEDAEIWLCTTCGFIFIGSNPPEKCPVCKVPRFKFEKIDGRVEL